MKSLLLAKNVTHMVDGFLGWEGHLLHLLHLNLLVENHTSLSLPSNIRVQISCDKIGGEETLSSVV
jgi:hypothetical protein